jgi:hypothetical protein
MRMSLTAALRMNPSSLDSGANSLQNPPDDSGTGRLQNGQNRSAVTVNTSVSSSPVSVLVDGSIGSASCIEVRFFQIPAPKNTF